MGKTHKGLRRSHRRLAFGNLDEPFPAVGGFTLHRFSRLIQLLALLAALASRPALAQGVAFPSMVPQDPSAGGWFPMGGTPATPAPIPTLPAFDPYAGPVSNAPPPAPVFPAMTPPPAGVMRGDGIFIPMPRFLDQVRFEGEWLERNGNGGLGITSMNLNASFAFPLLVRQPAFYVTPGFAVHYWDGPSSGAFQGSPDLPPRTYDAYLDTSWHPVLNPWLSADLGVRVGVYSDFNVVNHNSIRLPSRGIGIITLSPAWQVAAGVVYLDRFGVKILPAGGLIWTPNPDVRWEMVFPRPKIAQRVFTFRNTDFWLYGTGEYGGGAWTIRRANGAADEFDYNDYRVLLGIETRGTRRLRMWFEAGYAWNRGVQYYRTDTPGFSPHDTVMLRGGLIY